MKRTLLGLVVACLLAGLVTRAQPAPAFKLGTFARDGQTFVGVVLRDAVVIDFARAHAAVPAAAAKVQPPADMKDLIARYDAGVRTRILEIVAQVEKAGTSRPPYVSDLKQVKVRPPIMYPSTMLNVAVNYREHAQEMAGGQPGATGAPPPGSAPPGTTSIAGIWERKPDDPRWNPYMFIKLPSAVIASEESIRLPRGRTQIDWECELGVVIGRQASGVPVEKAR